MFSNLKLNTKLADDSNLKKAIEEHWGNLESFKKILKNESLELFGSGWIWLIKKSNGSIKIIKTFNQDNPWFLKFIPIIGIDLWEHSYYLKHNANRGQYFEDFWNVIDWEQAEKNFND